MRYLTLLLCAMLVTACANKHQERAVIAGAILGGMIGAVSSQPNANHAGNTSRNNEQVAPTTHGDDERMAHEKPRHHDSEEAKHEDKQTYSDDSEDDSEGEHEKDD